MVGELSSDLFDILHKELGVSICNINADKPDLFKTGFVLWKISNTIPT